MAIFKLTNTEDGDDDPLFVEAENADAAITKLAKSYGMPSSMLRAVEVPSVPEGFGLEE